MIRRSIAGLILGPSLLIGSLAWSGFVALRTVFEPDRSRDVAEELLDNDEVRAQLSDNIGDAIEATVPAEASLSSEQVDTVATAILGDPEVEGLILDAFTTTHAAFLGEDDAPRSLDLTPASSALRAAVVDVAPALESSLPDTPSVQVTLPTDSIPDAGPVRRLLQRAVPILAGTAIAGGLLALVTTSDRTSVLTRAGIWALSTSAFFLIGGFVLPWLGRRVAPDQVEVFAALVTALLRTTLIPAIVLALAGAAMIAVALVWPTAESRTRTEPARARTAPTARGAPQPAWPGLVPQPLVFPDSGPAPGPPPRPRPSLPPGSSPPADPSSPPADSTTPADPTTPVRRREPRREPRPPRPRTDRPPPLPTVASVSRGERDDDEPAQPSPPPSAEPVSSGRLPTTEQGERPAKWLPPMWVEGHGWVMDPDDPRPPPGNARWVEGVGHVVPGPPPD